MVRLAHPLLADLLTDEQRRAWAAVDGRFVRLGHDVTDCEGTYARWFDDLGAEFVVLRPDFYVGATAANSADLRTALDTVLAGLHLSPSLINA